MQTIQLSDQCRVELNRFNIFHDGKHKFLKQLYFKSKDLLFGAKNFLFVFF